MRKVSSGIPATTTSTALVKGLKALGVFRVSFATPYIDEVTQRGTEFLKSHGFDVVAQKGLGLRTDHEIGEVTLDTVYRLVKEVDRPEAQAVVISCTNLRTVGRIETMEHDLRKPVVSAIQASFWDCLRIAGVHETVAGFGRLLTL
jgi:maleate isomerase